MTLKHLLKDFGCLEEKLNITLPEILAPPKIAKDMLFHYGLIFIRTYFRQCLMNNIVSVWWRHHTGGRQSWATFIKGWRGTVEFCDWWFRATRWIVCKNRRHVPLLFIGGSAVIINRVNILMAGQLLNYGWRDTSMYKGTDGCLSCTVVNFSSLDSPCLTHDLHNVASRIISHWLVDLPSFFRAPWNS